MKNPPVLKFEVQEGFKGNMSDYESITTSEELFNIPSMYTILFVDINKD